MELFSPGMTVAPIGRALGLTECLIFGTLSWTVISHVFKFIVRPDHAEIIVLFILTTQLYFIRKDDERNPENQLRPLLLSTIRKISKNQRERTQTHLTKTLAGYQSQNIIETMFFVCLLLVIF